MNLEKMLNNFIYISSAREISKKKKFYFRVGYNLKYNYETEEKLQIVEAEKIIKRIVLGVYYFYSKIGFNEEVITAEEKKLQNDMEKSKKFEDFEKIYSDYKTLDDLISHLPNEKVLLIYLISIMSRGIREIDIYNYSKFKGKYNKNNYINKLTLYSEVEYDFIHSTIILVLKELTNEDDYYSEFTDLFCNVYNLNVRYYSRMTKKIEEKFKKKIKIQNVNRVPIFKSEIEKTSDSKIIKISKISKFSNSKIIKISKLSNFKIFKISKRSYSQYKEDFNKIFNIKPEKISIILLYIRKLFLRELDNSKKINKLREELKFIHFRELYKRINMHDSINGMSVSIEEHEVLQKKLLSILKYIKEIKNNMSRIRIFKNEIGYIAYTLNKINKVKKIATYNKKKIEFNERWTEEEKEDMLKFLRYQDYCYIYYFILRSIEITLQTIKEAQFARVIEDEVKKIAKNGKEVKLYKFNIEKNYFKPYLRKIYKQNVEVTKEEFDINRKLQMYLSNEYIITFDGRLENNINRIIKNTNFDMTDLDIFVINILD